MDARYTRYTRYIRHVTLTTGHSRDSYAEEIEPHVWGPVSRLLLAASTDGSAPIPGQPDYGLAVADSRIGRCGMAHVLGPDGAALVSIGVATHSRCGASLWRSLHVPSGHLATDPERCPPEPWCAVRLEPGIAAHPEAAHWLGDLERCIAWTWLRYVTEGRWPGID